MLMAHASKLEQNISDSNEEILKLKAQVEQLTITRQLLEQAAYVCLMLTETVELHSPCYSLIKRKLHRSFAT